MNDIESHLSRLLGPSALVNDPTDQERYLVDWTRTVRGVADAIVRPADAQEVARVVAWCREHGVGIVPQGGHTGLAGGATPQGGRPQVVLSLERLNRIRQVDPVGNTITVEAGAILQAVQQAALDSDRLFPLSLGAEGSCQIGGCISTNAGGTAVLRYGNMRELVLGLEVVLPDGSIWRKLGGLRKDNAGFDLKQMFIGAEGTLGLVTAATLRLFPRPVSQEVALVAAPDAQALMRLFVRVRNTFDAGLTAFEFMTGQALGMAGRHMGVALPLPQDTPFAALVEISDTGSAGDLSEALLSCLGAAAEAEDVIDAAIASSQQQADTFWALREAVPEAMLRSCPHWSAHDIALPIAAIPEFLAKAQQMVDSRWPQLHTLVFGHVGDGNLHYNFVVPQPMPVEEFDVLASQATDALYQLTSEYDGSFSAEHGIGSHKCQVLKQFASPAHLELMRAVKAAVDPKGIMNPGKVLAG